MTVSKKSLLLPLILLIALCLALGAIFGYIVHLHRQFSAYVPYCATPVPLVTEKPAAATVPPTVVPAEAAAPVPAANATPIPMWQFNLADECFWENGALSVSDCYRSPALSVDVRTVVDTTSFNRRVT